MAGTLPPSWHGINRSNDPIRDAHSLPLVKYTGPVCFVDSGDNIVAWSLPGIFLEKHQAQVHETVSQLAKTGSLQDRLLTSCMMLDQATAVSQSICECTCIGSKNGLLKVGR